MIDISQNEIKELLLGIHDKYGYDFMEYSPAHIKRRIVNRIALSQIKTFSELKNKILSDSSFASLFLRDFSIKVTEMFRDPAFYLSLREKVIPLLKTYSFIKVWHAGCASGEEVYSMAILLTEENLYDKSIIYATDFNQEVIDEGKEGIYSEDKVKEFTRNYQIAGGKASLSDYYTHKYDGIIMNKSLRKNIVWANHNLVTDSVFAEINIILCRNVMIYFDSNLQNRVHFLFLDSLVKGGILCLGMKENIRFSDVAERYIELDRQHKIYKKKYQ